MSGRPYDWGDPPDHHGLSTVIFWLVYFVALGTVIHIAIGRML